MDTIQLVLATEKDAELLHKLQVEAFMPLYEKYQDDETSPAKESLETIRWKITDHPKSEFYIIEFENEAVGGIRVRHHSSGTIVEGVNWISPIFVIPAFQGRGIAQRVVQKVFELYPDTLIWRLGTIKQEPGNCHLYEKCGFVRVGEEHPVNENMTLVDYEKSVVKEGEKNMIRLVRPTLELKEKALNYRQEHFDNGELIINGSELLDKTESYEEWLKSVRDNESPDTVSPTWVVTDTFFAFDDENEIVGIIDLRHTLNDFLKDFGNSGYSVRPSARRKGYATEMLRQVLKVAKEAGLKEVHLSVERGNLPSVRTIVKNGGVYERSFEFEGEQADIYRIEL